MSDPAIPLPDDPRSRAARTKRDRTRRALLDAADTAFGSRGWARTRMEDVAQAANVSAATAYNHFPTKHALLAQVYWPIISPLAVAARADVDAGRPAVEALEEQVRALCRVSARNRELTAAFWCASVDYAIKVGGELDPGDQDDPRVLAPLPEALRLLIEYGQQSGQLRPYPPAYEVAVLVINTLLLRSVNRASEPADTTAELLLTVMFGLLCPDLVAGHDRPFRVLRS